MDQELIEASRKYDFIVSSVNDFKKHQPDISKLDEYQKTIRTIDELKSLQSNWNKVGVKFKRKKNRKNTEYFLKSFNDYAREFIRLAGELETAFEAFKNKIKG